MADWPLASSPLPVLIIFCAYLCLVVWGPKWMERRAAWNLKPALFVYNAFQVGLSAYMVHEFAAAAYLSSYRLTCQTVDYSDDPLALRMAKACWWFFFSKIIDLADTVFFVLRKKHNQLSFLHVYHHGSMIFNWWLGLKYAAGGQAFFNALLNSAVHVVMYSYYFLSTLGPWIQPYLWWKKYLTQLQLIQFVMIITHMLVGLYHQCDFPHILTYIVLIYCSTLIILFSNFYLQSYMRKRRQLKVQ